MPLSRKREKDGEQLMRDAGLAPIEIGRPTLLEQLGVPLGRVLPGPPEWDVTVSATATGLVGERIAFTTLRGGDVVIDEEEGDADVSALADAVEARIAPPYRALAARQEGDVWTILARGIEVVRLSFSRGDELELSSKDSWRELRVDGEPSKTSIPELERLGAQAGSDFFVKAERLDGDLWEVRVSAL